MDAKKGIDDRDAPTSSKSNAWHAGSSCRNKRTEMLQRRLQ